MEQHVKFVKRQRIIVKNVHQHQFVRNVQQDIIQIPKEYVKHVNLNIVQIHVMSQLEYVKDVK